MPTANADYAVITTQAENYRRLPTGEKSPRFELSIGDRVSF
jgi:hypothetical protein